VNRIETICQCNKKIYYNHKDPPRFCGYCGCDLGLIGQKIIYAPKCPCEIEFNLEAPDRLWSWYGWIGVGIPTLPVTPVHFKGFFFEDRIHDWNIRNGKIHYYSRIVENACWLLLEYFVKKGVN
jgi:hypothetical protein